MNTNSTRHTGNRGLKRVTMPLSGKTVAITGGGRGIGRAIAEACIAAGANVCIGDIDFALGAKTAEELGDKAFAASLDVTKRDSFEAFLQESESRFGSLDVLVNNAGIMPTGRFLDESEEMTDRQIAINLKGVIIGSRLAAKRFSTGGGGRVINIASLAGQTGYPGVATYSATKFAVVGLTEALDAEFEDSDVSFTVILPGIVRTELSAGMAVKPWLRSFATVDPDQVGAAVVRAVKRNSPLLAVPRRLGTALRAVSMMPRPVRKRVGRISGMAEAMLGADPSARAAYQQRIAAGTELTERPSAKK